MSHRPLAGHPSLTLPRVWWSAEGGCHELANPSTGPWLSPSPRDHLQDGVPGRSQSRTRTWALRAWRSSSAGHVGRLLGCFILGEGVEGNNTLSMLGEALEFGTSSNPLEVISPRPSSQDLKGEEELGEGRCSVLFWGF